MNRKGFTLIELLAVIAILAIIAVITSPIILGVMEGARKDAAKDKAWGTINAVDLAYSQDQIKERKYKLGTPVDFSNKPALVGSMQVKASGELPTSGTVIIRDDGQIIALNLKFGSYTCSTVKSETDNTIDPNNVECVKGDGMKISSVVYRNTEDKLNIGDSIEGISTGPNYQGLGNRFLKHEIVDNKIISSEACFIKDGNMHCLKPNEYETSKAKLLEVFGEDECDVYDSDVYCYASSADAGADYDGNVGANDKTMYMHCNVHSDGSSECMFLPS